jgi:hypothetical protein
MKVTQCWVTRDPHGSQSDPAVSHKMTQSWVTRDPPGSPKFFGAQTYFGAALKFFWPVQNFLNPFPLSLIFFSFFSPFFFGSDSHLSLFFSRWVSLSSSSISHVLPLISSAIRGQHPRTRRFVIILHHIISIYGKKLVVLFLNLSFGFCALHGTQVVCCCKWSCCVVESTSFIFIGFSLCFIIIIIILFEVGFPILHFLSVCLLIRLSSATRFGGLVSVFVNWVFVFGFDLWIWKLIVGELGMILGERKSGFCLVSSVGELKLLA